MSASGKYSPGYFSLKDIFAEMKSSDSRMAAARTIPEREICKSQ